MNQRSTGLNFSTAIKGFLQYKSAEGLALVTVSGYERDLKLFIEYQGDLEINKITSQHIISFLNYLRTDYVPRRIAGDNSKKLTPKTIYNIYVSFASFFTWANHELELVGICMISKKEDVEAFFERFQLPRRYLNLLPHSKFEVCRHQEQGYSHKERQLCPHPHDFHTTLQAQIPTHRHV